MKPRSTGKALKPGAVMYSADGAVIVLLRKAAEFVDTDNESWVCCRLNAGVVKRVTHYYTYVLRSIFTALT